MKILIIGIILTLLSFIFKKKYSPFFGFFFVLLIMGLQYGVEGDYYRYKNQFAEIQLGWSDSNDFYDIGWFYLNKFFSFTSFPFLVFIISFVQYIILAIIATNYISKPYQYISAILFFFTFSFMLLQMKAIRQGLSVELCMAVFLYLDKKKLWSSLLIFIIAFLIHNSAIIMAPFIILFYFIHKLNWFENPIIRNIFYNPIIITTLYFVAYFFKKTILNDYLFSLAYSTEILRFSNYFHDIEFQFNISWLIVLYNAFIVFTITWFYKYTSPSMRFFFIISIIAAFCDMLFFGIGTLSRILMFFSIFNIIVYPNIVELAKKKFGSAVSFLLIIIYVSYAIKTSLPWMLESDGDRFGTYKYIFQ